MNSLPSDTDPRIEQMLVAGYRAMSVGAKLERVRVLTQAVQELALRDVRRRHPHATTREQALRVASRWLEPAVMAKAFSWDVERQGY